MGGAFIFAIDENLNLFAKERALVDEFNSKKLNPNVRAIVIVLAQMLHAVGVPAVVTSVYRDDSGIHSEWRACDVRSHSCKPEDAAAIRAAINKRFPYGLKSDGTPGETIPPLDHKAAQNVQPSTGEHFHVQVRSA